MGMHRLLDAHCQKGWGLRRHPRNLYSKDLYRFCGPLLCVEHMENLVALLDGEPYCLGVRLPIDAAHKIGPCRRRRVSQLAGTVDECVRYWVLGVHFKNRAVIGTHVGVLHIAQKRQASPFRRWEHRVPDVLAERLDCAHASFRCASPAFSLG